ncbi:MAG TPA: hypothetical protein DDW42_10275 [Desulfobacteraceae bacterium]|nr:hypothetical protein [Desulfobacteraceae bacterium]
MTVSLTCPYCNFSRKVSKEKIPTGAKWATCPRCHQRFEFLTPERGTDFTTQETNAGVDETGQGYEKGHERKGSPWENRSELGLWQGIFQTFKAVLFSPERLFSSLTYKGGLKEPLAFGILVGSIGSMLGFFWQFLIFSAALYPFLQSFFGKFAIGLIFLFLIAAVPIIVTLSIFIYGSILHLLLLIVRGGKNGFEGTFRVVSYSQATQLLGVLPFIGGMIAGIWQLIVQIIGLREIHDTSYVRVIIAFLIPVALIFLLLIGILIPLFIHIFHNQHLSML